MGACMSPGQPGHGRSPSLGVLSRPSAVFSWRPTSTDLTLAYLSPKLPPASSASKSIEYPESQASEPLEDIKLAPVAEATPRKKSAKSAVSTKSKAHSINSSLSRGPRRASSKPFDLFRMVSVVDLANFHEQIEEEYHNNPFVFQEYLRTLAEYRTRGELKERIRGLFKGHDGLIETFEEFLDSRHTCNDAIATVFTAANSQPKVISAPEIVEYLDEVRERLENEPEVFEAFVAALTEFKYGRISRQACINTVLEMLRDNDDLAERFEAFVSAETL